MQPQHGGGGESERDPHHVGCGHRGPRGADRALLQRVGLLPGLQVEWHVSDDQSLMFNFESSYYE